MPLSVQSLFTLHTYSLLVTPSLYRVDYSLSTTLLQSILYRVPHTLYTVISQLDTLLDTLCPPSNALLTLHNKQGCRSGDVRVSLSFLSLSCFTLRRILTLVLCPYTLSSAPLRSPLSSLLLLSNACWVHPTSAALFSLCVRAFVDRPV